ncbi:MAG: response regulator transcription factor [Burkholderiales bacterium]|nr:response regulator transcription factor [Burkholderiales bacterium]
MIRILVADDHAIVRAGLSQFIADQPDMRVEAEAACGDEVIRLVDSHDFDVVLLDIAMPNKNGLDCLRILRQTHPGLPVLILSGYPEANYAVNMLRAGASGYVSKLTSANELMRAIRIVAKGRKYLSASAVDLVSAELTRAADCMLHETLSEREFQVFRKLAEGQSATHIAAELNVSIKTVTTYRARVLQKMNLKTNADLTYYAVTHKLLE